MPPILKSTPLATKQSVQRICCVCRKLQPVTGMQRVVRVQGEFFVQGKKPLHGRGAHVCQACCGSSALRKALSRSFKTQVPDHIFQQLAKTTDNVKL